MEALNSLKSVLCGPDGKCCISGSQADRDIVDKALAAIAKAEAAQAERVEPEPLTPSHEIESNQLRGEIQRLAVSIWQQHYKSESPHWTVLNDSLGALSQISNMVTGMTRTQPAAAVSEPLTKDDVRAAGGIVHSDGNIFFTNIEQLNAAIRSK